MEQQQQSEQIQESSDVQLDTFDTPAEDGFVEQKDLIGETEEKKEEVAEGEKKEEVKKVEATEEAPKPKQQEMTDDLIIETKVDGKVEKVSLKDLKQNYSGKVAWDKKFSELGKKSKEVEKKLAQNEDRTKTIVNHFDNIMGLLQDDRNNPIEPLLYILDKSGYDQVKFKKRLFDSFGDIYTRYSEMDDLERELYWQKEENDYLKKSQAKLTERQTSDSKRREVEESIARVRAANGLSEEDYVSAFDELVDLGNKPETIQPQMVVRYLKLKPMFDKAQTVVDEVKDQLNDGEYDLLVSEYVRVCEALPKLSEKEVFVNAARNLGYDVDLAGDDDEIVENLNRKHPSKKEVETRRKVEKYIDTFNGELEYE